MFSSLHVSIFLFVFSSYVFRFSYLSFFMKTRCDCCIIYFLTAIGIPSFFFDLKVPAAAMMVVGENYQVDAGIEGSNGKGAGDTC